MTTFAEQEYIHLCTSVEAFLIEKNVPRDLWSASGEALTYIVRDYQTVSFDSVTVFARK